MAEVGKNRFEVSGSASVLPLSRKNSSTVEVRNVTLMLAGFLNAEKY